LSWLFNFQSIDIQTWNFLFLPFFAKICDVTPTKNGRIGQKINFYKLLKTVGLLAYALNWLNYDEKKKMSNF